MTTSKENVRPSNTSTLHPKKTTQPQLSFLSTTLTNEVVKLHIRLCYFDPCDRLDLDSLRGQLLVTNYMVCFICDHKNTLASSSSKFFELPLGTIERIEKVALEKGEGAFIIRLVSRDSRPNLRFSFEDTATSLLALNSIRSLAFPEHARPFALAYSLSSHESATKNNILMEDFKRMKVFENNEFRIFHNTNYQFCETYPSVLVVPSKVSDDDIKEASQFRTSLIFTRSNTPYTHATHRYEM